MAWAGLHSSNASAQLISLSTRKDHVFNPVSRLLYITTSAGAVQRYSVDTQSFLTPWTLGGTLGGIDVTPNGATVLVGDSSYDINTDLGVVRRVNAASGSSTTVTFPIEGGQASFSETGAWDVLALSDSKAYFSTDLVGSGQMSLHEWNLDTNQITAGIDAYERSRLSLSYDRNSMLILDGAVSPSYVHRYDVPTNTYRKRQPLLTSLLDSASAISRDGQWIALEFDVSSADESRIYSKNIGGDGIILPNITGGLFFHPTADVLYGVDIFLDDVVAFDTNTWTEIGRTDIATNAIATTQFNSGATSFDPVTNSLFLSVPGGIYKVALPAPPTPPHPLDYSRNGTIGDEDYAAWRAQFGKYTGVGDGNRDGLVNAADYVILRNQLSDAFPTSATSVPEPHLLASVAITFVLLASCRRARAYTS